MASISLRIRGEIFEEQRKGVISNLNIDDTFYILPKNLCRLLGMSPIFSQIASMTNQTKMNTYPIHRIEAKPHTSYSLMTDERQLWQAFRNGSKEAFAAIFKKYYDDLYGYGVKFSNDRALVKDALQDLFVEIWARRAYLGDVQYVKAYLLKSLRRRLLRTKKSWRSLFERNQKFVQDHNDFQLSIEDLMVAKEQNEERLAQLDAIIQKLTKAQKEVIYLKFYNGLDYEEISQVLNIKYQSVRNTMHRTLTALRANL